MTFQKFLGVVIFSGMLSACAAPGGYYNTDGRYVAYKYNKKGVPVVSASRGSGEYVSREAIGYTEYVSALDEAKKEGVTSENMIDEYVASLAKEKPNREISHVSYESLKKPDVSQFWGKPKGSVGEGLTLMNESLRKRFNDALSTTPVGSQAKWRYNDRSFIFMPNSDIFQPFYSGGNCRDGVFINYKNDREEKVRGLFCQKGRGADWFYLR